MNTIYQNHQPQAIVLSIVNRNRVTLEDVLKAMGLSCCNVRCLSTNIAKGKAMSKSGL